MTLLARSRILNSWAAVSALGILVIGGLEAYALSQGINGNALTAALVAIAALGGTTVGRLLK